MKELTQKQKHKILKKAKKIYLEEGIGLRGMCYCLNKAIEVFVGKDFAETLRRGDDSYDYLQNIFPEFNSMDLANTNFRGFWWDLDNTQARIDAFNKLIKMYRWINRIQRKK